LKRPFQEAFSNLSSSKELLKVMIGTDFEAKKQNPAYSTSERGPRHSKKGELKPHHACLSDFFNSHLMKFGRQRIWIGRKNYPPFASIRIWASVQTRSMVLKRGEFFSQPPLFSTVNFLKSENFPDSARCNSLKKLL